MLNFLNIYIIVYLITLLNIQLLLYKYINNNTINSSITYLLFYINKFSKYKFFFLILLLSLTGLPPFIMFFIKFNILIILLVKINFIYIIIVFLTLFLNMIYYIQIFLNKNIKYNLNFYKNKKKYKDNYFFYYINLYTVFLIFNIFLFSDIYYLSLLFC